MRSRLLQRNLREDPPLALSGEGIFIRDSNGKTVIDGSGGAAVACLGHAHPHVLAAMREQMEKLCYAHTALYSCESAERLADMVLEGEPGGLTHLYLCSSGSEGTEAALKMARQYHLERGDTQLPLDICEFLALRSLLACPLRFGTCYWLRKLVMCSVRGFSSREPRGAI